MKARIDESKAPQPAPVAEASFQAEFKTDVLETLATQNVVALLEGSDPKLKEEIVAFSAHYDHLHPRPVPAGSSGGSSGTPADRIYNGADDDGTGTVGILALAEAFAQVNRPRRSLLFVWHAGEEIGLRGSDYFVRNPTRPLENIVALFNVDMIGRNFEDKESNTSHVFLVGASRTSRDLRDTIHRIANDRLKLDENDTRNYFQRSDHYHYARKGVPVAFFCTGEHKDYHRPTDHVEFILFEKMKKILDVIFEAGLELANQDQRPAFTGERF